MIRNILLSAIASLKRKKMASIFTLLTISLGMTMIVLLASIYNSFTGNIGPYKQRTQSLYLANMEFISDGEIVQRERHKGASATFIDQYLRTLKTPELIGMYGRPVNWNLGTRYKPFQVKYLETDANFWKIHHFSFVDGRAFLPQEVSEKEQVCILSEKAAKFLFNELDVVGKYYHHSDKKFRIVGVIQNEHPYFEVAADLYMPYTITVWSEKNTYKNRKEQDEYYNRGAYKGVLQIAKNTSLSTVKKEFRQLANKINKQGKVEEFDGVKSELQSSGKLISALLFPYSDGIVLVSIMVLLFLLVPIIILSNINFYALSDRIEEIGIRKSFGATKKAVILQLIIENIIITSIGGIIALFISFPLNRTLSNIIFNRAEIVGMEFNFTYFILLICGILIFGFITIVIPAIRISKMLPAVAIHQFQNSGTNLFFKSRKKWLQVFSHFILFTVLAMSTFFVAYVQFNSFSGVGYNTKNTIVLMLGEKGEKYRTDEYNRTRFKGLREKLLTIPEVKQVSYVLENPPTYIVPQYQKYDLQNTETEIRTLETDSCFFTLLEIEAVKGELYTNPDKWKRYLPGVATLAAEKKYFDGNAMGKIISREKDGKKVKIIGIIDKYKHHPQAIDYEGIFTCRNKPSRSVVIKYDAKSNAGNLEDKLEKVVSDNFDNAYITQNDDIEVDFNAWLEFMKPPFYGIIMGISFLLINALFGFFTLIWYNVKSRKKELGIRRAVGANKNRIQKKIIVENLLFMFIGSAISAFVLSQIMIQILSDSRIKFFWIGLLCAFAVSFLLTLISTWFPSRTARNIHPIEALAEE